MIHHIYIFLTVVLVVYSQLVMKWQVGLAGDLPIGIIDKVLFLLQILFRPWVISGFAGAFLASLSWMAAMSKFPLSYAYPFMSLAFVLVLAFSSLFFQESVTLPKVIGMALIVAGIIIGSQK